MTVKKGGDIHDICSDHTDGRSGETGHRFEVVGKVRVVNLVALVRVLVSAIKYCFHQVVQISAPVEEKGQRTRVDDELRDMMRHVHARATFPSR